MTRGRKAPLSQSPPSPLPQTSVQPDELLKCALISPHRSWLPTTLRTSPQPWDSLSRVLVSLHLPHAPPPSPHFSHAQGLTASPGLSSEPGAPTSSHLQCPRTGLTPTHASVPFGDPCLQEAVPAPAIASADCSRTQLSLCVKSPSWGCTPCSRRPGKES